MSELKELFTELGISEDRLRELADMVQVKPIAAMLKIHEMDLPTGTIQKAMAIVMANPAEMDHFATSLGLDAKLVEAAKKKLDLQ